MPPAGDTDTVRLFSGGKERALGRRLVQAAEAAVETVLGVKPGERMLIVTNPDPEVFPVAQAVHDAAVAAGADVALVVQAVKGESDAADPIVVAALEAEPDIVVTLTTDKLGVDPARARRPIHDVYAHYFQYLIGEARSRGFWSPGVTRKAFERTVPIDYPALREQAARVVDLLAGAEELVVRTANGTELVVPVDGSKAKADDGDLRAPGRGGNLPCGEVLLPVRPGSASGTLVVDGTLGLPDGPRAVKNPVTCTIEEGLVTRMTGGADADALQATIQDASRRAEEAVASGRLTRAQAQVYAGNARRLTEVGLGLNPAARLSGHPLVDDKALGTFHCVLGSGTLETPPGAPVAVDAVLRRPSLFVVDADGAETPLLEDGRLRGATVETVRR